MNHKTQKPIILLTILAIIIAIINASVFAYYPITINVTGAQPIVFSPGKNANQTDLGDNNNIVVIIGSKSASLIITVHPTYQYTYYKNITLIKNTDSTRAYYIAFNVSTTFSGFDAKLYIYDDSSTPVLKGTVNLLSGGITGWYGPLNAGHWYRIDLYFHYPETASSLPSGSALIQLIYSPSNTETPPQYIPP